MNNFYDPIPDAQAAPLAARRADTVISVPQIMAQTMGQVYAPELVPTDLLQYPVQGPSKTLVGLSSFGACPTPTGEMFSVGVPVMSPQLFDSFGLPVPGGPASGLGFRVARSTATSKRYITNTHSKKVARLPYVSANQGGKAISVTGYGLVPWVDANGVTHQPPGLRDPVVNKDTFDVLFDGKTIKLDASTNQLYADILGLDAPGSASNTIPAGPITAGHAIIIIPGAGPSDAVGVSMVAGSGIDQPATFQWAFSMTRYGKETGLSPGQSGTTDGTHGHASIVLPPLPTGDVATAYTLYRKDTAVGADGSIQTNFAYTSTTGAVLISDPSTGAVAITSGPDSGLYIYKVVAGTGNIHAGDEYLYNAKAYVIVGDPPVPIDPRDGSHLRLDVNANGDYVFVAADTAVFNAITGKLTYPAGSPKNATVFKTVAVLTAAAQTYVDSTPNASLGAVYTRGQQTINVKKAAYALAPFSGMVAIPGTSPAQYEYNGLKFSSATPSISNDGLSVDTKYGVCIDKDNHVDVLLAASGVLPAAGTGDQTARALAGYDGPVFNESALTVTGGDSGTGLAVLFDGTSITQNALGELQSTGSSAAVLRIKSSISGTFGNGATAILQWSTIEQNVGGFTVSSTDITIPATGEYEYSFVSDNFGHGSNTPFGTAEFALNINGTWDSRFDYRTQCQDSTVPLNVLGTMVADYGFTATAGDIITISILNSTAQNLSVGHSYLMIHRVG